jgi:TRAP-type C4-dicarboxylate transport system substrate-binding protein
VGAYVGIRLRGSQACRITGHAYTAAPILMNLAAFRRLAPAEQEGLLQAAQEAAGHERAYVPKTARSSSEVSPAANAVSSTRSTRLSMRHLTCRTSGSSRTSRPC